MTGAVRVLVTGAGGQLGRDLLSALERAPAGRRCVVGVDHATLDVADRDAVHGAVLGVEPDVVVHCAAWTAVDACEADPERAFRTNALGTRHVAEACRRAAAHLVYVSTDYVFDGTAGPYCEWDTTNPLSVYGRSKRGGELEAGPESTIVRTSWVAGRHGANFVATMLRLAAGDGPVRVVVDQLGAPTFTEDLAAAIARLAIERRPGIFHVTNTGETSWHGLAEETFHLAGADPGRVQAITTAELDPPRPAPRPMRATLDNLAWRLSGFEHLPPWQDSLERLVRALRP